MVQKTLEKSCMIGVRRITACVVLLLSALVACAPARAVDRMREHSHNGIEPGYRFERGGWTYVHLEGSPSQIGFQHGSLLAIEIADLVRVNKLETLHSTHRDWE